MVKSPSLPRGQIEAEVKDQYIIDCNAEPYLPPGFKGVDFHRKHGQLLWSPDKVELLCSQEQQGDDKIEGKDLWDKLQDEPLLNANVLDYLLKNPYLIPDSWKGKRVYFWGTVYRDHNNNQCVRCLFCIPRLNFWYWFFSSLVIRFDSLSYAALHK
jgi:hypothetical protein